MEGVLTAAILCSAFRMCCTSLDQRLKPPNTRAYIGTATPVQIPQLLGTNVSSLTVLMPSFIANTPPVTANSPSVTADSPPVTAQTPPVTANSPPVTAKTPSGIADTNSSTVNLMSLIANTPPMTANTPSVTDKTPPVTANSPSATSKTPSGIADTNSSTVNLISLIANTPPMTASTTTVSTYEGSRYLRGLRTHMEGDRIVFHVNADFLADCVEGSLEGDQLTRKERLANPVYLIPDATASFKRGTLRMGFRMDKETQAPGNEELIKRCVIDIEKPQNGASEYNISVKILSFEVSPEEHFQVTLYTSSEDNFLIHFSSFDKVLERPHVTMIYNSKLYLEVEWFRLPQTFSMDMQFTFLDDEELYSSDTATSPMTGIKRTPLWDGFSAYFGYAFSKRLRMFEAKIYPPEGHNTMISWEQIGVGDWMDCTRWQVAVGDDWDDYALLYCGTATPSPVLLTWRLVSVLLRHFEALRLGEFTEAAFTGYSMRFSFHNNASARPQQLPDKTWNCSVAHWPDFKQHLLCDLLTECAGGEDEADCSYTNGMCRHGYLAAGGSCFTFGPTPETLTSWVEADAACRRRGARLPTLNTPAKWRAVVDLLSHRGWENIYVGLSSGDPSLPDLYTRFMRWSDLSVAYYIKADFLSSSKCITCAFLKKTRRPDFLYLDSCIEKVPGNLLCEIYTRESPEMRNASRSIHTATYLDHDENKPLSRINYTRCVKGHVTHNFLSCDPRSYCYTRCYTSVSIYLTSLPPAFKCNNGFDRVPYTLMCDHRGDCSDASDEICIFRPCQEFQCDNKQCVDSNKTCDGVKDCLDGSDERNCSKTLGTIHTLNFSNSIPAMVLHDGKGLFDLLDIADTSAHSTSLDTRSTVVGCPDSHFLCPGVSYYCLPVYVRCNDVIDCPGHEDEADCDDIHCPGFYRCRKSKICLHGDHLCDGVFQCPQRDDELMCGFVCPVGCTCYGLAFFCTVPFDASRHVELRFLDANGSGMSLKSLSNYTLLFYLSLARCNLTQLETMHFVNVFHLDLSDNSITTLTENHISSCQNLQVLVLAGNPLRAILEESSSGGGTSFALLHTLDLSAASITAAQVLNLDVFFPNVLSLNLSNTKLDAVSGFSTFNKLRVLDLRGCPLTYFTRSVFQGLNNLTIVHADNYKLCCPETLPDGFNVLSCHAPFDEVSSCEGLLKSGLYRVSLSVMTCVILMGNAGSFVYRVLMKRPKQQSSFSLFVTNLCVSDFLMGLYSAIIGVNDRLYLGSYLWNDVAWRRSAMCKIAGVLSLVSNEVSVLLICLITVDRFLVTRFPFSRQLHLSLRSARVACVTAWSVGVLLATLPLLPATSHWQLYGQTGICIPLPVIRKWFAGRQYSFGILIILNFVLFLVIASGQMFIYLSIRVNTMTISENTQKAKDLAIARRFVTVALSDFMCWFPVGLLGILSARGQLMPDEANVVIAVFVLPLNSALNPFLYTVNVILERRQKAREHRLLQIILCRQGVSTAQREGEQSN